MRRPHEAIGAVGTAVILALGVLLGPASDPVSGQLRLSGQVETTAATGDNDQDINTAFRGDNPFNALRARIFAQHWISDRVGVFAELFFDNGADPRLNGAYVVVNDLAGREWISARVGLAPSPIGSFGLRSTYFGTNPLVGIPLIWQYRTTLDGSGLADADDLLRRRQQNRRGIPVLYDTCWNIQWELMGAAGMFEYSAAVTAGSLSNPPKSTAADGVQFMGRVGMEPVLGLKLGVSGAYGPYIGGEAFDPEITATSVPGGPEDYDQALVGADLEWARGRFQLFSEYYAVSYEAPLVAETLKARGGYVEGRYDFLPRWTGAARVGTMTFSDIEPTGGGSPTGWDDDVLRTEVALTYRWSREVHLRADWQHNDFRTGSDESADVFAVQLRAVF